MLDKQPKIQKIESYNNIQDFYSNIASFLFKEIIPVLQNKKISSQLFRNALLAVSSFYLNTKDQEKLAEFIKKSFSPIKSLEYELIINSTLDYLGIYIFTELDEFSQERLSNHNQLDVLRHETQLTNKIIENLVDLNLAISFFSGIFKTIKENIIEPFQDSIQELESISQSSVIQSDINAMISQIRSSNWEDRFFTDKSYLTYQEHFILASDHTIHAYMRSNDPAHQILGTFKAIALIEDLTNEIEVLNQHQDYFRSNFKRATILKNGGSIYIHTDKLFSYKEYLKFLLFYNPAIQDNHLALSSHPDQELIAQTTQRSSYLSSIIKMENFLKLSIEFEDEILPVIEGKPRKTPRGYINIHREKFTIEKSVIINNLSNIKPAVIDQETSTIINSRPCQINIPKLANFCMTFAKLELKKHNLELSDRIQKLLLINLCAYLVNLTFEYFIEKKCFIQNIPIHEQDQFLDENRKRRLNYLIPSRKTFEDLGPSLAYIKIQPETSRLNINLPTSNLGLIIGFSHTRIIQSSIDNLIKSNGIISAYNQLHSINNQVIEDEFNLLDNIFNELFEIESLHDLKTYATILIKLSHAGYNRYIKYNHQKTIDLLNHLIEVFKNTDYTQLESQGISSHTSHRFLYFLNDNLNQLRLITNSKFEINKERIKETAKLKTNSRTQLFTLAEKTKTIYSLDLNEIKASYAKKVDLAIFKAIIKKTVMNIEEIQILLILIKKYDLFEGLLQNLLLRKDNVEFLQTLINSVDIEAQELGIEFIDKILLEMLKPGSQMPFYIHYTYAVLKAERNDLLVDNFYATVALKIVKSEQPIKQRLENLYQEYNKKIIKSDRRNDSIFYKDYLSILKKDGII